MLSLSRKQDQEIIIQTPTGFVRVFVIETRSNSVRLAIEAPKEFKILRGELTK